MSVKITLSGALGSGKSTVGKLMASRLGIPFYSTGMFFRDFAKVRDMDALQANLNAEDNREIDDYVDGRILQLDAELDAFILDSRMAWHFVKQPIRFYLDADPIVAAERVFKDGSRDTETYGTLDEAVAKIAERAASERKRYTSLYKVDIGDLSNYQHRIETTGATPEQIADCMEKCLNLGAEKTHWQSNDAGELIRL